MPSSWAISSILKHFPAPKDILREHPGFDAVNIDYLCLFRRLRWSLVSAIDTFFVFGHGKYMSEIGYKHSFVQKMRTSCYLVKTIMCFGAQVIVAVEHTDRLCNVWFGTNVNNILRKHHFAPVNLIYCPN